MAFGRNKDHITINGHAPVSINTGSGYQDVGYVDNVFAKLAPIDESTNDGPITIGFDESVEFDMRQTSGIQVSDIIDARTPTALKVTGPDNIAEVLTPTLTINVEKGFNGKTGSKISVKAIRQGVSPSEAKSFIRSSAS